MNERRFAGMLTILVLLVGIGGCNSEKLPRLGRVSGVVTLDGQPVPEATVTFAGAKEGEPDSIGKTDAAGKYELYYSRGHKGATIGDHPVFISTYKPANDDEPQAIKEAIPLIYNGKSELKQTVKRGNNTIDFQLKGGEIIQPEQMQAKGKKKGKK